MDQASGRRGRRRRSRFFYELSEDLVEAIRQAVAGGEPNIDPEAQHLWEWFWEMNHGRQAGFNGWLALPLIEIKAWCDMTGNILRREEIAIVREMDRAFLAATQQKGDRPAALPDEGQGRDLTPSAFDAVFG